MPNDSTATIPVPVQTQQQFPELVELILKSESMNDEERKYWINILPAMTPEQQTSLKEILVNERDQLAAIDAKYATSQTAPISLENATQSRRTKRDELKQKEQQSEEEDTEKEDEVLKEIDTL